MQEKISEDLQSIIDRHTAIAREEGFREGRTIGTMEGRALSMEIDFTMGWEMCRSAAENERNNTIRKLASSDVPIAVISKAYECTEAEIRDIIDLEIT